MKESIENILLVLLGIVLGGLGLGAFIFSLLLGEVELKEKPIIEVDFILNVQGVDTTGLSASIAYLNELIESDGIRFSVGSISNEAIPYTIEEMIANTYDIYFSFSQQVDTDTLMLYVAPSDGNFCNGSSCSKTGGFSLVNSSSTNNVVINEYDLTNAPTVAHEFLHWLGLKHTFEYGGDNIKDTPFDDGNAVGIDYFTCVDKLNPDKMVNNIMSYYKPCVDKPYALTKGQRKVIRKVARKDKSFVAKR